MSVEMMGRGFAWLDTGTHASLLDCVATRAALGENAVHWRTNLRLMLKEEARLV